MIIQYLRHALCYYRHGFGRSVLPDQGVYSNRLRGHLGLVLPEPVMNRRPEPPQYISSV